MLLEQGYSNNMSNAALTTEQKALSALRIAPVSIRDVGTAGGLNAFANLTRKGLAVFAAGAYVVTARGMQVSR
jgi:hypothetical protein